MRYCHFLRGVTGDGQPKQAAAVETEANLVPHPTCPGVEIETLRRWWLCRWEDKGNGPEREIEEMGTDCLSFWAVMERMIKRGLTTWVFALPASRILGLVGFWDMLEMRRVYISGVDYRYATHLTGNNVPKLRHLCNDNGDTGRLLSSPEVPELRDRLPCKDRGKDTSEGNKRTRSLGYAVLEDPPTIVQCRMRGRAGSLRIVDLRNYGYSDVEAPKQARDRCWWIRQVAQTMTRTLREQGLGGLQNTASSQAFTAFKKRYLKDSLLVHCDAEALHLERTAYYGGRTEAARIGMVGTRTFLLDFKSFYPALAGQLALPARLVGVYDKPRVSEVHATLSTLGAIALCRVSTNEPAYPLRRKHDTIYPTGEFWTALAGPELEYALQKGHITEIERAAYYELSPACAEYATGIAKLREEAEDRHDRSGAEYLKRLGVALYGKFAQTSAFWLDSTERLADHPYHTWCEITQEGNLVRWRSVGWEVQKEQKYHPGERPEKGSEDYERWRKTIINREAGESIPAIAGYITSSGRILLWRAIQSAGQGNVFYYDTDSLFVNEAGLANLYNAGLVCGKSLGRLSIRAVTDNLLIHGFKNYEYDGNIVCSGMPKGQHTPAGDNESYYLRAWIGRSLCSGVKPQTHRATRAYNRTAIYRQGQVTSEGRVIPWRIG